MASQVQSMQKLVAQLRQEADIQRIPVSKAIEDMVSFVNDNSTVDGLVTGVNQADNPFRDQKSCAIL